MQKHLAASRRDDSVQFNELCNQLAHHSMPTKGDDCGLIVHHDVHDASQPKSDERPQKHAESLKLSPVRRLIFPKDWTSNCVDLWMLPLHGRSPPKHPPHNTNYHQWRGAAEKDSAAAA